MLVPAFQKYIFCLYELNTFLLCFGQMLHKTSNLNMSPCALRNLAFVKNSFFDFLCSKQLIHYLPICVCLHFPFSLL